MTLEPEVASNHILLRECTSNTIPMLKNPPHLVTLQSADKIVCDCRLYKSPKICEHYVVTAEINGKLEQYLEWRKRDKTTVNLS